MVDHIELSKPAHLRRGLTLIQRGFQATGRVVEEIATGSRDTGDTGRRYK